MRENLADDVVNDLLFLKYNATMPGVVEKESNETDTVDWDGELVSTL